MSYHVFLVDGPLGGERFGLHSVKIPDLLYIAKLEGLKGPIDGWALVGTERTPPEHPYPEQASYELDAGASMVQATRGILIYAWIDPRVEKLDV